MRFGFSWLFLVTLTCLVGCGGSTSTAPVAEQDELAKYVAEHPETQETNTTGINP
jgi:hypothetical protein